MKKTNVTLVRIASGLSKIIPVLLCLFLLGSSDLAAQDFKSIADAKMAVKEALEEIPSSASADISATSSSSMDDRATAAVYNDFLVELDKPGSDVEESYNLVKEHVGIDSMKPTDPRRGIVGGAIDDLLDLITEE